MQIPIFEKRTIDIWCEAAKSEQVFGLDDSSDDYAERLLPVIGHIARNSVPTYRQQWLESLSRNLQTQEVLSAEIGESLDPLSGQIMSKTVLAQMGTDLILQAIRENDTAQTLTLQLIVNEGSTTELKDFAEKLSTILEGMRRLGPVQLSNYVTQFGNTEQERRRELQEWARVFHREFWAQSHQARTVAALQFLVPPSDIARQNTRGVTRRPGEINSAFVTVLNSILPRLDKYHRETQQYLAAYLRSIPPEDSYAQIHALSALLVAAERRASGDFSPGIALRLLCELMGPAETKGGQAAASHTGVPKDIRDDLGILFHHATEPPRPVLFEWIREAVPAEERAKIKHYGDVLGSGSFFITIEIETEDGPEVLQILRPHAEARAEAGFRRLQRTNQNLEQSSETFGEVIEEARSDATVEVDPTKWQQQAETFEGLYNNWAVVVSEDKAEHRFPFTAPRLISSGARFRRMSKLGGEHFIDLKAGPEKKRASKAVLALELCHILSGRKFDKDATPGNATKDGNTINRFDSGGALLEAPTREELSQLAELVF